MTEIVRDLVPILNFCMLVYLLVWSVAIERRVWFVHQGIERGIFSALNHVQENVNRNSEELEELKQVVSSTISKVDETLRKVC